MLAVLLRTASTQGQDLELESLPNISSYASQEAGTYDTPCPCTAFRYNTLDVDESASIHSL